MDISEKENEREGQGYQPVEGLPEEAWTWGNYKKNLLENIFCYLLVLSLIHI